jgi:hypothetical protein
LWGTQPKKANASASPCRTASVRSVGRAIAKGQLEYDRVTSSTGTWAASVGEVGVDVAEVGLGAVARRVVQRDEGLAAVPAARLEVATDLVIAAGVAVLGAQPAEDLGGGVSLLARGGLVGVEDGIGDRAERAEGGRAGRGRDEV